jgi:hypothetical protein
MTAWRGAPSTRSIVRQTTLAAAASGRFETGLADVADVALVGAAAAAEHVDVAKALAQGTILIRRTGTFCSYSPERPMNWNVIGHSSMNAGGCQAGDVSEPVLGSI